MRVLLINVSLRPESPVKMFPLGLGYVATAIKQDGFSFDLLDIDVHRYSDVEVDDFLEHQRYDVICFGCIVTGYRIAKDLAARIRHRQPETTIIAGNTVASSIPEILLDRTEVDIAVLGEGDVTIVELIHALQEGKPLSDVAGICYREADEVRKTPKRTVIRSLDCLPAIDYDIFDIDLYINNHKHQVPTTVPIPLEQVRGLPVNTARGCIASCTFCYHAFQKDPYRRRTPHHLLEEIAVLLDKYDLNYISMADELTFYKKEQALEFSRAVLDSGLKFLWPSQCRSGLFDAPEDIAIAETMRLAGCVSATFSLESAAPEILKAMHKNISVEGFIFQAKLFHQAGIPVNTSLVFGYPQETADTIRQTFDVCVECSLYPSSGFLLPQPGSGMYDYALEHGYITDEESYLLRIGDRQDLHLNLTRLDDEELISLVEEGAQRCNDALGLGLDSGSLIKAGQYKGKKH